METARINLTIPAPVDALIAEMASVTGQSKSSLIASILTFQMPKLRHWLDAYQSKSEVLGYSLGGIDMDSPQGLADPKRSGPARHHTAEKRSTELTRQQRRALEREQAKEKRRVR